MEPMPGKVQGDLRSCPAASLFLYSRGSAGRRGGGGGRGWGGVRPLRSQTHFACDARRRGIRCVMPKLLAGQGQAKPRCCLCPVAAVLACRAPLTCPEQRGQGAVALLVIPCSHRQGHRQRQGHRHGARVKGGGCGTTRRQAGMKAGSTLCCASTATLPSTPQLPLPQPPAPAPAHLLAGTACRSAPGRRSACTG